MLHAAGGSFFERGLHIERPTPVSPAGSVGSRQSATGARSPPSRKGNEWGRMTCWYGRGRLFYTSHFKGGAGAPPLEPLYSKPGLSALGGCEGGGAPPRRGVARGSFPLRGIQRGACPPLRVQRRESCPPPNPSHARTLRKKGAELAREGDFYFQNNIKFFKGAGLGCRLGRSWTVPTGHQDPPLHPQGRA